MLQRAGLSTNKANWHAPMGDGATSLAADALLTYTSP